MNATTAALYIRVSTGEQHTSNQLPELRALAAARGFEHVEPYEETGSAVKRRPTFDRMMADVRAGRVGVVCVWSLDRLGRGFACFDTFRQLSRLGVRVLSVREPWTDVDGPARDLLAAVMSWVSGFERERLIERTRAGLDRARRQGVKLGQPRASPLALGAAARQVEEGASIRKAARSNGVARETLRRHVRRAA